MKHSLLSLMLGLSFASWACDNCNIYLNTSPNDYRNSIGIFMRQRQMYGQYNAYGEMIATKHAGHGNDIAFWGKNVYETYQTMDIRGSFYIREKWKTTIIVPVVRNIQFIEKTKRYGITGISDPIIMQSYQVFSTKKDTVAKTFQHRLTVGAGLKFPVGKTQLRQGDDVPNLDLQPGSGSWDTFIFATYNAKLGFAGLESYASYKRNGRNATGYRYGKSANLTVNLFADIQLKGTTLRLLSGVYGEAAGFDETFFESGNTVLTHTDTGGEALFASGGIKYFVADFLLFGEYQKNVYNQLNGYTQLLNRDRINIGVIYNF